MTNPYLELAERQQLQHARRHARRVAAVREEKQQDDQDQQLKLYRKSKRADLTSLLENPFIGDKVKALMAFLKTLGPNSADVLVDYVDNSEWLKNADINIRQACLSYISLAIMRVRIQQGLAPFDDAIGEEPANAFLLVRKMLTGV